MLKHVQISPMRNRADTVSIRSSISCSSSLCSSPEPLSDLHSMRTTSRASSYSSLNELTPQTTIKIFTSCLRVDIEYKTLGIQWETTTREVVRQVLRRCKMRHRDPKLFYLSMEVTIRKAGVKTLLKLEDEARPALLQACHPKGDSRFCLQMKPGGLIRVHTSTLQTTSQYKSLVIAEETTSDELLGLLLSTYNSIEPIEQFSLYEVCPGLEYQRKLHPDDLPLRALQQRSSKGATCHFLVRRNPNYPRRRQLLPSINESGNISASSCASITSTETTIAQNTRVTPNRDESGQPKQLNDALDKVEEANRMRSTLSSVCTKCRNSFKSCEFCQQKIDEADQESQQPTRSLRTGGPRKLLLTDSGGDTATYNPVYNIREIRTVCHSFSSLGIDKKLLDIQINQKKTSSSSGPTFGAMRRQSVGDKRDVNNINNRSSGYLHFAASAHPKSNTITNSSGNSRPVPVDDGLPPEQVNANGKFLYI